MIFMMQRKYQPYYTGMTYLYIFGLRNNLYTTDFLLNLIYLFIF